jgi:hypothetical protein
VSEAFGRPALKASTTSSAKSPETSDCGQMGIVKTKNRDEEMTNLVLHGDLED